MLDVNFSKSVDCKVMPFSKSHSNQKIVLRNDQHGIQLLEPMKTFDFSKRLTWHLLKFANIPKVSFTLHSLFQRFPIFEKKTNIKNVRKRLFFWGSLDRKWKIWKKNIFCGTDKPISLAQFGSSFEQDYCICKFSVSKIFFQVLKSATQKWSLFVLYTYKIVLHMNICDFTRKST